MAYFEVGEQLYEKGDFDIFDKLLAVTDWERPVFNKGRVYLKMGDFDNALSCFEGAILMDPENPDAYYYLGLYYEKKKDYEQAKKFYKESLRLDEGTSEVHLNLGVMYLRTGEFDAALKEFEISKEDEFDAALSYANIGIVLYQKKEYEAALENLIIANRLMQEDTELMNDIAKCHYYLRNFKESLDWLSRVLQIDSNNKEAITNTDIVKKWLKNASKDGPHIT